MHFPLDLSAKYPFRSNIPLRFRWRKIKWNMYSFYYFLWKPYDTLFKYNFHGLLCNLLLAIFGLPRNSDLDIGFSKPFDIFFCHKHLHIYSILLRNMRLSNFTSFSVLSFAHKPKLAYLTRPIKNKKKTRKLSAKINTNSNLTFESKMNLKSVSVCTKSIKITAILVTVF